jgi:hypothetical protein
MKDNEESRSQLADGQGKVRKKKRWLLIIAAFARFLLLLEKRGLIEIQMPPEEYPSSD